MADRAFSKRQNAKAPVLCTLGFLGVFAPWAPLILVISRAYALPNSRSLIADTAPYVASFAAAFLLCTIGCVLAFRKGARKNGAFGVLTAAGSAVVGCILLCLSRSGAGALEDALLALAGLLLGVAGSLLYFNWNALLNELHLPHGEGAVQAALAASSLAPFAIQFCAADSAIVLSVVLVCAVSAVAYVRVEAAYADHSGNPADGRLSGTEAIRGGVEGNLGGGSVERPSGPERRALVRIALSVGLLSFAIMPMIGSLLVAQHGRALAFTNAFGVAGVLTVVAVLHFAKKSSHGIGALSTYRLACIPVMAALFPPLDALDAFSLQYSFCICSFSLWMLLAFLMPVAREASDVLRCDSVVVHCSAMAGFVAGLLVSCPFSWFINTVGTGASVGSSVVAITSIALAIVACNVVLTRPALVRASRKGKQALARSMGSGLSVADAVEVLGKRFELTPREKDVLLILARGYGLAKVQEDLYISEGTAITHRNHIYRKLDVHSKADLLALVDETIAREQDCEE